MGNEKDIEVENIDLIEEVHDRIDVLIEILEKKGILTKEEYEAKYEKYQSEKEEN